MGGIFESILSLTMSSTNNVVIEVGAGLVFDQGRLLITRRPQGVHLAGLWEFPGGKREHDESFAACVERELMEELGLLVRAESCFSGLVHRYPEKTVRLEFWCCRVVSGVARPIGCSDVRWVRRGELRDYSFPAADHQLLELLERTVSLWAM